MTNLEWSPIEDRARALVKLDGREYEIYVTDIGVVYGLYRHPFKPHYREPAFVLKEGLKNMKEAKKWAVSYVMQELKFRFRKWATKSMRETRVQSSGFRRRQGFG